jgi:hypothetical protein
MQDLNFYQELLSKFNRVKIEKIMVMDEAAHENAQDTADNFLVTVGEDRLNTQITER